MRINVLEKFRAVETYLCVPLNTCHVWWGSVVTPLALALETRAYAGSVNVVLSAIQGSKILTCETLAKFLVSAMLS